jgi:hypothetical protein
MAFQVKRIMKRIYKKLHEQKGFTIYDRAKWDARMSLEMFCAHIQKKH